MTQTEIPGVVQLDTLVLFDGNGTYFLASADEMSARAGALAVARATGGDGSRVVRTVREGPWVVARVDVGARPEADLMRAARAAAAAMSFGPGIMGTLHVDGAVPIFGPPYTRAHHDGLVARATRVGEFVYRGPTHAVVERSRDAGRALVRAVDAHIRAEGERGTFESKVGARIRSGKLSLAQAARNAVLMVGVRALEGREPDDPYVLQGVAAALRVPVPPGPEVTSENGRRRAPSQEGPDLFAWSSARAPSAPHAPALPPDVMEVVPPPDAPPSPRPEPYFQRMWPESDEAGHAERLALELLNDYASVVQMRALVRRLWPDALAAADAIRRDYVARQAEETNESRREDGEPPVAYSDSAMRRAAERIVRSLSEELEATPAPAPSYRADDLRATGQEFPVPGPVRRVAKVYESRAGFVVVSLLEDGAGEVARAASRLDGTSLAAVDDAIQHAVSIADRADRAHVERLVIELMNDGELYAPIAATVRRNRDRNRAVAAVRATFVAPHARKINRLLREDGDAPIHFNDPVMQDAAERVVDYMLENLGDESPQPDPQPAPQAPAHAPRQVPSPKAAARPAPEGGPKGKARRYKLDPDVEAVLRRSTLSGDAVNLPPERLDPRLYARVKKALGAIGAEWDRKADAHVFKRRDARDAFAAMLASGGYEVRDDLNHFPTPPELAARLVDIAHVGKGDRVLEPSAGEGNVVAELLNRGASVVAVELDGGRADVLEARFPDAVKSGRLRVVRGDFLALPAEEISGGWPFRKVVMNPPFALEGQPAADVEHVMRAISLADHASDVVAVMSRGAVERETPLHRAFRAGTVDRGGTVFDVPAGAFKSSGTSVPVVILRAVSLGFDEMFPNASAVLPRRPWVDELRTGGAGRAPQRSRRPERSRS